MIDKDKAVDCLKKINGMEKYLVSNPQKYYLESKMIYDNPAFLEWKTKVKDLLGKFRQTKLISETIATLDSFNGYSDEKLFPVLKAKIENIINDIDDLIPNKRKDTSARLKIPTVFISYNQKSSETCANKIEKALNGKAIVQRDTSSIGTWDDIYRFMDTIRDQDFAILLITDEYLKSLACMHEVLEIMKEKNWKQRVKPIVLDGALIYTPEQRANYIAFWERKYLLLETKTHMVSASSKPEVDGSLRRYEDIKNHIGEFLDEISRVKNPSPSEAVSEIVKFIEENYEY